MIARRPRRFSVVPPDSVPFAFGRPFCNDVLSAYTCGASGLIQDAIHRQLAAGTHGVGPKGSMLHSWTIGTADTTTWLDWTTGPFTVAAWFRVTGVPVANEYPIIISRHNYVSESNNQGWYVDITASNHGSGNNKFRFAVFRNNAVSSYNLVTSTTATIGDHCLVCTSDGTTRRIYLNGHQEATTTNSPTPVSQTTNGVRNTVATTGKQFLYFALVANRAWTPAEALQFWAEPFSVFQYQFPVRLGAAPAKQNVDRWNSRPIQMPIVTTYSFYELS